jgi:glycosyltransferase involved in cell wall biosynthesis
MTILIDARILRTTTGRYVEQLLKYLQEVDTDKTHNYTILLKPEDMDTWSPTNERFTKISSPYKEFTFSEQIGLWWQIHKLKPDLVHFTMVQQPILYRGKVVTTMHDLTTLRFINPSKNRLVFSVKQQIYKWVNGVVAHKSKAIITPSNFVKHDIANFAHIDEDKIAVVYEAGELIPNNPELVPELLNKKFIMYVGRPTPHKNLSKLIDAFALLKTTHPDLHLVLVGKEDKLFRLHKRETQEKNIPDVHFTGFVGDSNLRWLYENCSAYVFPSLSEGFGLPGLEAMAHGAPVVSSNSTCLPEILGNAARYFDATKTEGIVSAIDDVLNSQDLRNKLILAGSERVKDFSWKRTAEQTLQVYNRVISRK